jgi:GH24 family phage-related lysozyme (muramidase)
MEWLRALLAAIFRRPTVPTSPPLTPAPEPAPSVSGAFQINAEALALIKRWEGFRADAYQDAVGVWTIGYGTTARAGVGIDPKPGMRITEAQATGYLLKAIDKFATAIKPGMKRTPTSNQYGAMLSLAYNIGPTAFLGSTVLRRFNSGDLANAANAFLMWNKAGGRILQGLVNRRHDERALFLKP